MSAAMEFGVSLPGRGPLATPESILQLATNADVLRYDSLFVTDHVVLPASMAVPRRIIWSRWPCWPGSRT
jgi:hypothetical protein